VRQQAMLPPAQVWVHRVAFVDSPTTPGERPADRKRLGI